MSRRVSLPGADELFRSTQAPPTDEPGSDELDADAGQAEQRGGVSATATDHAAADPADDASPDAKRTPSGRVRHDEKITVYVTADELLDLERTRLVLRGDHRLAVDRGRIVREAIHLALQGVRDDGDASALVQRLREQ